ASANPAQPKKRPGDRPSRSAAGRPQYVDPGAWLEPGDAGRLAEPGAMDRNRAPPGAGARGRAARQGARAAPIADGAACALSVWLKMKHVTSTPHPSPPRKRAARACPWLEQGATARALRRLGSRFRGKDA